MISQNNTTTFLDSLLPNNPQLSKSGFDFSFTDDLEPFARTIIIIVGVTFLLMILCALRACCRESQKRVARNQPSNDETQFDTTELGIICSNHHRPSSASSHLPNPNQLHHHHHHNNNTNHHHHLCHHCTQNDLFVPYLLPQPGPAGYIIPPPVAPPTYEESLNHRKDPLDVSNLMVSTSPTAPTYGLNRSGTDNTNMTNTNMPTNMGSPAAEVVDARSRD